MYAGREGFGFASASDLPQKKAKYNNEKGRNVMFCTKCGNQIPDGSAVCTICGAQFAAPQAAPQPAPAAPQYAPVQPAAAPKAKKAGGNKLPIIIGAIAAAAVIAIALILILRDGAKAVVKDYLNYQEKAEEQEGKFLLKRSEKALKALDLLDDDDDDDDDDYSWSVKGSKTYSGKDDEFEGLCNYIEDKMKGETKKVSKMAIVEVKIKKGKDSDSMFFTCVKVSGNWYVLTSLDMELGSYMTGDNIKDVANKWAKYGKKDKD